MHCRGEGGAGPSKRIPNQALVDADCDWIIVCPCGFTIEDTKKEEDLLSTKSWWYAPLLTSPGPGGMPPTILVVWPPFCLPHGPGGVPPLCLLHGPGGMRPPPSWSWWYALPFWLPHGHLLLCGCHVEGCVHADSDHTNAEVI